MSLASVSGTGSSNPSPSSGESANFWFLGDRLAVVAPGAERYCSGRREWPYRGLPDDRQNIGIDQRLISCHLGEEPALVSNKGLLAAALMAVHQVLGTARCRSLISSSPRSNCRAQIGADFLGRAMVEKH